MENEILNLIDRYWKFDDDQTPLSNWHDKQDLLDAVRKALRIHDVSGRSKLLLTFLQYVDTIDLVEYDTMSHEDIVAGFEESNSH